MVKIQLIYDEKILYRTIQKIMAENSKIVIFGAGSYGKIVYKLLNNLGYGNKIIAFCDNSPEKWGKDIYGIKILSFNQIKKMHNDIFYLICSTWSKEIKGQLEENKEKNYIVNIDINNDWIRHITGWKNIAIDIVDNCNLRCKSCPQGRKIMESSSNKMSLELFEKIIDKAESEGFKTIGLFNWTEPLLHPQLDKFIKHIKVKNMDVCLSTNLSLRNIDNLLKSFDNGLDSCYVTVSGYSQEVHEINHIGSDINIVKKNLTKLSEYLRSKNISTYKVLVKYLVFSYNVCEKELFGEFCNKLGFLIEFVDALEFACVSNDKNDIEYDIPHKKKDFFVCNMLFYNLPLDYKGDVYVCCADPNTPLGYIGNYLDMSQEEIFFYRYFNPKCSICKSKGAACIPDELKDTLIYEPILKVLKQINQNT